MTAHKLNRRNSGSYLTALCAGGLLTLSLAGCGPSGNEANVELIQDMMVQESVKPQEADSTFKDGISQRVPPEHTQPIGFTPYKWGTDLDAAIRENKNPLAGKTDDEILIAGQNQYNTNCMICHGRHGNGDGPIKEKYPLPIPSLRSEKVRGLGDAQIYHIITMGQGTMGPYASMVPADVRWQLVNYIRHLQQSE